MDLHSWILMCDRCFVHFSLQSSCLRVGSRLVVDVCVEIADRCSLGLGWLRQICVAVWREFDAGRRFTREVRLLSRFAHIVLRLKAILPPLPPK